MRQSTSSLARTRKLASHPSLTKNLQRILYTLFFESMLSRLIINLMVKSIEKYSLDIRRIKLLIQDQKRRNLALRKLIVPRHNLDPELIYQYRLDNAANQIMNRLKAYGIQISDLYGLCDVQYAGSIKTIQLKNIVEKLGPGLNVQSLNLFLQALDRQHTSQFSFQRFANFLKCLSVWHNKKQTRVHHGKILQKFSKFVRLHGSAATFFDAFDQDKNGSLSLTELKRGILEKRGNFPGEQILVIFRYMDPAFKGNCKRQSFREMVNTYDSFQQKQAESSVMEKQIQRIKVLILSSKTNPMDIFNNADAGNMGIVTEEQLTQQFVRFFPKEDKKSVLKWIKLINQNNNQFVERAQYVNFFKGLLGAATFDAMQPKAKAAIKQAEYISVQSVLFGLKEFCKKQNIKAKQLFRRMDHNKSGSIDLAQLKEGLVGAGMSVGGAIKTMALFDADNTNTIQIREFVQMMGEQYQQQQQQVQEGDDFEMQKNKGGDKALPKDHLLAQKIHKERQSALDQTERLIAQTYAKRPQKTIDLFYKYDVKGRIQKQNLKRVIGQIVGSNDAEVINEMLVRAGDEDWTDYSDYLQRLARKYNMKVEKGEAEEEQQNSSISFAGKKFQFFYEPKKVIINAHIVVLDLCQPLSVFLRPLYRQSTEIESVRARGKDPYFVDHLFSSSAAQLGKQVIFKPLKDLAFKQIISYENNRLARGAVSQSEVYYALQLISQNIFSVHRLFQNWKDKSAVLLVWICLDGFWKLQFIDSYLPTLQQKLVCTTSINNQLWPGYLQKALAKATGGYSKLSSFKLQKLMSMLTGNHVQKLKIEQSTLGKTTLAVDRKCPAWVQVKAQKALNLNQGVYSIVDVKQVLQQQNLRVQSTAMIKLRNLTDPLFVYKGPMQRQKLSQDLLEQLQYSSSQTSFWIPYKHLINQIGAIQVCWYSPAYFTSILLKPSSSYFVIEVSDIHPGHIEVISKHQLVGLALVQGQCQRVVAHSCSPVLEIHQFIEQGRLIVKSYSPQKHQITLKYSGVKGFQFGQVSQKDDQQFLDRVLKKAALIDSEELDCYDQCPDIVRFEGERMGIRYFYFLNESSNAVLQVEVTLQNVLNLKIDRPFLDNTKFSLVVAPKQEKIVKFTPVRDGPTGYIVASRSHEISKSLNQIQTMQMVRQKTRQFNKNRVKPGVTIYQAAFNGRYYWMYENYSQYDQNLKVTFKLENLQGQEKFQRKVLMDSQLLISFAVIDGERQYSLSYSLGD